jgi:hypothetical protein
MKDEMIMNEENNDFMNYFIKERKTLGFYIFGAIFLRHLL